MASAHLLELGSQFGGYEIEGVLGRGGMGVVYEARQVSLDRTVAIKVLAGELEDDRSFQERFRVEQRLMAAIEHPHIVTVYEAGEVDGLLYLAMRLVRGPNLKDLIGSGELDAARALRLLAQAADALDAAHEAGLIHRDIKPQNLLVGEGDHLYLTDFGLTKAANDRGLTRTGQLVGTLDYIAPEQIRGEAVTSSADLYAFGCVLYEALTGIVPFRKPSEAAVLYAHMSDPPPLVTEQRPDLPRALDEVIARALAKDPAARYLTAGQLVSATQKAFGRAIRTAVAPPQAPQPVPPPVTPPPPPPAVAARQATPPPRDIPRAAPPAPAAPSPPQPTVAPQQGWGTIVAPGVAGPEESGLPSLVSHSAAPVRFRLKPDFCYVHQPLADDGEGIPMLGNERMVATLKERIVHSIGGSFLVTGFRGVGKTTVIARALSELRREGEPVSVLPVSLNVARPRTVEELLFEIIRRVFETLKDEEILERMAPRVQRELLLAYARTSLSFNETRSNAVERSRNLGFGAPGLLEALSPKLELSKKTTDSLATQASFLAYTDTDVEHDFLRIVSLVDRGEAVPPPSGWNRMRRRRGPADQPAHWRGKLVVVIDELDKLTASEDGMKCVQELLSGLKNLLTARGVHFLFVAGPDMHDEAIRESRRGNSVYESVFGWQVYVPCLWQATDQLLATVLAESGQDPERLESFRDYLKFKSRGVPRLLLMELNSFVRWTDEGPVVEIAGPDLGRVEFYAALERVLDAFVHRAPGAHPLSLPIDEDRWRLGAYYLTDSILRSEGRTFTVAELINSETDIALDPLFKPSETKVAPFLAHLVEHQVIRQVAGKGADRTYYGDVPSAQQAAYALAPDIGLQLARFARVNERERADLGDGAGSRQPWADSEVAGEAGHGRYELLEELDRGGLGRVYRARDRQQHREVAVKIFDGAALPDGGLMRARFARKADIARSLSHDNIVPTYETFEEEGRLGLVMGLVNGTSLEQLMRHGRLTPAEAVGIALPLASALSYLHERDIARLDLKPSSILVDERFEPLILDLGLAKVIRGEGGSSPALTAVNAVLGTPAYAAPEQLRGEPADIRSDIFSLGLILYEMLAGRRARAGDVGAMLAGDGGTVDIGRLRVSDELRAVVARAVAATPVARWATPQELREALAATPEAQGDAAADDPVAPVEPEHDNRPTEVRDMAYVAPSRETTFVHPRGDAARETGDATLHIEGSSFPIPPDGAVIGRWSESDIVVAAADVSRRHARVARSDGGWIVEDLGSINGTWVNGSKISDSQAIRSGDTVMLGSAEGVFDVG